MEYHPNGTHVIIFLVICKAQVAAVDESGEGLRVVMQQPRLSQGLTHVTTTFNGYGRWYVVVDFAAAR